MQFTHTACDGADMQIQHMVCSQRVHLRTEFLNWQTHIWFLFKSIILSV